MPSEEPRGLGAPDSQMAVDDHAGVFPQNPLTSGLTGSNKQANGLDPRVYLSVFSMNSLV